MEWIIGSFFAVLLSLLVYSIISTSVTIRKKAQPTVDSFFEALYAIVLLRKPGSKGNRSDDPDHQ